MKVQVICQECDNEMTGSEVVYEDEEAKTQSREYICNVCRISVNVVLTKG